MTRIDSPRDRALLASQQVMVLLGPWQSCTIVTWHASMLGRYFSSQSGVRFCMPLWPQWAISNAPFSPRLVMRAAPSSLASAAISPAPMWHPIRWGGIVGSASGFMALVVRPASRTPSAAAATASSTSRHMTFVALR